MTLTYLGGGLSTSSIVWVSVEYLFRVYKHFAASVQKFLLKALKGTAHTFFSRSGLRLHNSFLECSLVALVCPIKFWSMNDDF